MQKKTMLWSVFVVSGFLTFWSLTFGNRGVQTSGAVNIQNSVSASSNAAASLSTQNAQQPSATVDNSIVSGISAASVALPALGEELMARTNLFELTINTKGAALTKLKLLSQTYEDGSPVLLASDTAQHKQRIESELVSKNSQLMALPNNQTIYRLMSPSSALTSFDDKGEMKLVFEANVAGIKHIKTYTFFKNRHDFELDHTVMNQTSAPVSLFLDQRLTRDGGAVPGESSFYHSFRGVAVYSDEDKYQKVTFSDIDKNKASFREESTKGWIAQVQHYFVVAMLNDGARINQVQKLDINYYGVGNRSSLNDLAPNTQVSVKTKLFAGPQIQKELTAFAPSLDAVVDYGWLAFLAKPLFWLLGFLQGFIINWGWTIVALTVLIKLLFFPLSAAGYRAMAKMREITPKLMALREKYKDDRLEQQRAMMKLYQEEKVNPLGGCLPMIIPIPVFLALYWVLLGSVELRSAQWLWIKDLSSSDPYYILPVLMAITTFLQSKMSPPATDPLQAKMMLFMPLIFSIMFIWFPAGLVLYWVVNNVLSIAQQWWINKTIKQTPRSQGGVKESKSDWQEVKTNRKEQRDNMKNVGKKTIE